MRLLPAEPYLVADAHLRRVGNDALISFEASLYSVPADRVRAGQRVQVRAGADTIAIVSLDTDGGTVLALHRRSLVRGAWVIDPAHWASLPDGHTRATTNARTDTDPADPNTAVATSIDPLTATVISLVGHVHVEQRPLSAYAI